MKTMLSKRVLGIGTAFTVAFTMAPAMTAMADDAQYELFAVFSESGALTPGATGTITAETYDTSGAAGAATYDYSAVTVTVADSTGVIDNNAYASADGNYTLTADAAGATSYTWYKYGTQGPGTGIVSELATTAEYNFDFVQGPGPGDNPGYYIVIAPLGDNTYGIAGIIFDNTGSDYLSTMTESQLSTYADTVRLNGRPEGTKVDDTYTFTSSNEDALQVDAQGNVTTNADLTETASVTVTVTSALAGSKDIQITIDPSASQGMPGDMPTDGSTTPEVISPAPTDEATVGDEDLADGAEETSASLQKANISLNSTVAKAGKTVKVVVKGSKGKVTVKAANKLAKKNSTVNGKKIKISNNAKAGKYKYKVKVAAKGNYAKTTKKLTLTVK